MRCVRSIDLVLQRRVEHLRRCLPRGLKAVHRPQVYSVEELEQLLTMGCVHPKHRHVPDDGLWGGLRLKEGCHLKAAPH